MYRNRSLPAALLMAAVVSACLRPETRPNVVIIAIDTLRADHLGCYGYSRPTSPHIDALATEGVVFEQTIAQSPWTLPSFASILTGVIPQRHGAGQGKSCLRLPCGALVSGQPTLAELLQKAGYRTAAFVSNGWVAVGTGVDRGFETVNLGPVGGWAMTLALRWLHAHRRERLFLFVHLIEPHLPYAPPAEDAAPFVDPSYAGPIGAKVDFLTAREAHGEADVRRIVDLYDGEILTDDRLVGTLLDTIRTLGLDDRTLVLVVSDHGEELLERGTVGHGHSVYDELIRVPLVVRFPGGEPRGRVHQQVRAMDVFPTVLEVAGVPVPAGLDAVSLVGMARGEPPPPPTATAISEFTFNGPELRSLRRSSEKLIVDADAGSARLFDLAADPGETVDVGARDPERVTMLRAALDASRAHGQPGLYVLARGGERTERFRAILMAPRRGFSDARMIELEDGDVATVTTSGRVLNIDFTVAARDLDGVRVVADPDDPVTVGSLSVDGERLQKEAVFLGTTPALSIPRSILPRQVVVPHASPPPNRGQGGVKVAFESIVASPQPSMQLDPAAIERLRALGYAE